jgi:hypothetical protein
MSGLPESGHGWAIYEHLLRQAVVRPNRTCFMPVDHDTAVMIYVSAPACDGFVVSLVRLPAR